MKESPILNVPGLSHYIGRFFSNKELLSNTILVSKTFNERLKNPSSWNDPEANRDDFIPRIKKLSPVLRRIKLQETYYSLKLLEEVSMIYQLPISQRQQTLFKKPLNYRPDKQLDALGNNGVINRQIIVQSELGILAICAKVIWEYQVDGVIPSMLMHDLLTENGLKGVYKGIIPLDDQWTLLGDCRGISYILNNQTLFHALCEKLITLNAVKKLIHCFDELSLDEDKKLVFVTSILQGLREKTITCEEILRMTQEEILFSIPGLSSNCRYKMEEVE